MLEKLTSLDLIRLNVEIEHDIDSDGNLLPLPGKESALLSISRHQDGYVTYLIRCTCGDDVLLPGLMKRIALLQEVKPRRSFGQRCLDLRDV